MGLLRPSTFEGATFYERVSVPDPECVTAQALEAAAGFDGGRSARLILSMLPPGPKRVFLIGEPSTHFRSLITATGSQQVVKLKPTDGALPAEYNSRFDLLVDSQGGDDLPARVHARFSLLRYQGLYIAEHVESCASQRQDPETLRAGDTRSCAAWWTHLVELLNRPNCAGQRLGKTACTKFWDCDLQIESLHVWNGVVALRKGSVHPHWDQNLSQWFTRDVSSSLTWYVLMMHGIEKHTPFLAADERDDRCWRYRRQFYNLCAKHGADKGLVHGYWRGYGVLLERFRRVRGFRLAEFGLALGNSLRVWADYFGDDAVFHTNDVVSNHFDVIMKTLSSRAQRRVYMHSVEMNPGNMAWAHVDYDWNATTRGIASMRDEVERAGGFHVVVDDAGHSALQNFMFFHELVGTVLPGGYYICEDLAAGGFRKLAPHNLARPGLPQAIRRTRSPIDMFVAVTQTIAGGKTISACDGCEAGLVSAHWWLESVFFERGL